MPGLAEPPLSVLPALFELLPHAAAVTASTATAAIEETALRGRRMDGSLVRDMGSAFHGAGGESAHDLTLEDEQQREDRQRHHHRGRDAEAEGLRVRRPE